MVIELGPQRSQFVVPCSYIDDAQTYTAIIKSLISHMVWSLLIIMKIMKPNKDGPQEYIVLFLNFLLCNQHLPHLPNVFSKNKVGPSRLYHLPPRLGEGCLGVMQATSHIALKSTPVENAL
jgi:predicted component of type VI protein secretion system